jgi:hypothetical protein
MKEIKLRARIIDTNPAKVLPLLEIRFNGTNPIAELTQITASLPPAGTKEVRNKELQKQLKNPSVFLHGPQNTLVSSRQGSPYAVEILVKPMENIRKQQGAPGTVHDEEGHAFVDIHKDQVYEVKLHNNSNRLVAAAVSIDGLDVFYFSKVRTANGWPIYNGVIIEPNSTKTIVGWPQTGDGTENFLSFLTTEYGKGAGSPVSLAGRGQVGVIHVQFSECSLWPGPRAWYNGTAPSKVGQKSVRYQIEPPRDFVSVRFNR